MLTGCSSNDIAVSDEEAPIPIPPKEELVDLNIGASALATTTSRGIGTVGGTTDDANKWHGQDLWLFMTNKGTMKPAQFITSDGGDSPYISLFNNKHMKAPTNADSGLMTTADGAVNYYPMAGNFDFFGYHINDAAIDASGGKIDLSQAQTTNTPLAKFVNTNGTEVQASDADKIVVPFKIDGSQDLMAGKATPSTTEANALGSDRYYSAYSAKKNVTPNVSFNHLLTRLTFSVVAGDKTSAGLPVDGQEVALTQALSVEKIQVESKAKGEMTVAYKEKPESMLSWDDTAASEWFTLKRRYNDSHFIDNLLDLEPISLTWDTNGNTGNVIPRGEALLVQPDVYEYNIKVLVKQWVQTNTEEPQTPTAGTNKPTDYVADQTGSGNDKYPGTWTQVTHEFPTTISLNDNAKFQAGTSYNVKIYLYGLTKLEVMSTLNKWETGEDIEANKQEN